jgi:hypothetical protein
METHTQESGTLRVGKYDWKNKKQPETKGFINILVHVKESMSPFQLRDEKNRIMENVWQFQKCYEKVSKQTTRHWKYPTEEHYDIKKKQPTAEYWVWRKKGLEHSKPVRWPNGREGAKECLFHIVMNPPSDPLPYHTLDYIEARKLIYFTEYVRLVRKTKEFRNLQWRLQQGENFQINEVDGPRYAKDEPFDQVQAESIQITPEIVKLWLHNPSQPFGHGVCLAIALLNWDHLVTSTPNCKSASYSALSPVKSE